MKLLVAVLTALSVACASPHVAPRPTPLPMDLHSHAQPERVRVTHVALDLTIDMDAKAITGTAALSLVRSDRAAPLVLDATGIAIETVKGKDGSARRFALGPVEKDIGSALTIELAPADELVVIAYRTTERSDALQWLAPEQTADKRQPFLFTQGQSIFTRTWIPLQDSPGVRITYEARVKAPKGLTVVMSAEQLGRDADGAFRFRMPHAIPSYLIALACGDLAFRPISKRCGLWAEPSVVDGARAEFEDSESMVQAAEKLFGPYRWGRYDLIVLPPSFPFGGMENPCLTFATPTALTGDKSGVSLVAHELAHSWSGNLVTNATWRDFWLNEGFTVYFEQRIMEAVYGAERARMEWRLAVDDLKREMSEQEPWLHVLHIDLADKHPDDGFSGVPYTKGAAFLKRVESLFGRERFDRVLTKWFDAHAFQSVTTETFLAFLERELLTQDPKLAAALDVKRWIEGTDLPDELSVLPTSSLERVDREIGRWKTSKDAAALDTQSLVTQQWLHLLEGIAETLDARSMAELDARFALTKTKNCEIADVWLRLSIQHRYAAADARLEQFLTDIGRRKFLEPLYKELKKTPEGLARARTIYTHARSRYHALTRDTIDELLGWPFTKSG
ncbi:MAG: M1 family metallopeptidase [Planctomycetes bacterium]|nr:M1 family metallopeptidase [Planctomycetota bacterium]